MLPDHSIPFAQASGVASAVAVTLPERNGYYLAIVTLAAWFDIGGGIGSLVVTSAGKVIFKLSVVTTPTIVTFPVPVADQAGEAITIALSSGGVGATGFISGAYVYVPVER